MIFYGDIIVRFNWIGDETVDVFAMPVMVRLSKSIIGDIVDDDCSMS